MAWAGIVNKFVDVAGFKAHVDSLKWGAWHPSFVVVHNTDAPDRKLFNDDWWKRPRTKWSPEIWGRNLESYYRNDQKWSAGPHAFVTDKGILLFTPLTVRGTHAPSWNKRSIGIETVGNFDREPFDDPIRTNLIEVLAILHARLDLDPADYARGARGLHFHKEDPGTKHKDCPGKHVVKSELVAAVAARIPFYDDAPAVPELPHVDVPISSQAAPTGALSPRELTSVQWLQLALTVATGVQLGADGILGPLTKKAVQTFQRSRNLVADGIAGPVTRLALKQAIGGAKL